LVMAGVLSLPVYGFFLLTTKYTNHTKYLWDKI